MSEEEREGNRGRGSLTLQAAKCRRPVSLLSVCHLNWIRGNETHLSGTAIVFVTVNCCSRTIISYYIPKNRKEEPKRDRERKK